MGDKSFQKDFLGQVQTVVNYLINDLQKKPRSLKIGVFSIFLVIGFLTAIQSSFQLAPLIFLNISENQVGDADIILTPVSFENDTRLSTSTDTNPLSTVRLVNTSDIDKAMRNMQDLASGNSPRWIVTGVLTNPFQTDGFQSRCYVNIIDSVRQRSMGIGRRFREKTIQNNQAYVTGSVLRALGMKENQDITLNIDFVQTLLQDGGGLIAVNIDQATASSDTQDKAIQLATDLIEQLITSSFPGLTANNTLFNFDLNNVQNGTQLFAEVFDRANQDPVYRQELEDFLRGFLNENNIANTTNNDFVDTLLDSDAVRDFSNNVNDTAAGTPNSFSFSPNGIAEALAPVLVESMNFTASFRVVKGIDSPKGKWAEALGNVITIDSFNILTELYNNFVRNLQRYRDDQELRRQNANLALVSDFFFSTNQNETLYNATLGINLDEYAILNNIVLTDRVKIYQSAKLIQSSLIISTNSLYKNLGKSHPTQPTSPLSLAMQGILIFKMFLDNMIASAIFLLIMLAVLLIYSLMISDVEEKTYEFGMLRALGLEQRSLVALLLLEGLVFAIPGLCLGLLMAYLINSVVGYFIFGFSQAITSYQLHWSAIVLGVVLGVFIPLISNYLPIQRALSQTLRDSLDLYHRAAGEISITIHKLEKLGISPSQALCAMTLILMGVICYYFAPRAFIYQDIALFLAIINMILILMILGFTLILNMFQNAFQKFWLYIILLVVKQDQHLRIVVEKNMEGHRRRNSKTALMYTIALAFLIFAGTGFSLQTQTIQDFLKVSIGADFLVQAPQYDLEGIDEKSLREYMNDYTKKFPGNIKAFSFQSIDFENFPLMKRASLSPLSQFPQRRVKIFGVERNYLDTIYEQFYQPDYFDETTSYRLISNGKKDCMGALYSTEGNTQLDNQVDYYGITSNSEGLEQEQAQLEDIEINAVIPTGLQYEISMNVKTPALLDLGDVRFRCRIRAMCTKLPGFQFSGYRSVAFFGTIAISLDHLSHILQKQYELVTDPSDQVQIKNFYDQIPEGTTYKIPKRWLQIRFARQLSLEERQLLGNGLRNYFQNDQTSLIDVPSLVESTQSTLFFIDLFYVFVAIISLILSFFLILVSFISNVKENSWEFGVLRAVGLNKGQITRVYMYEAFILTFSSGLIGTLIGIIVAITLTLQFLMFTELPFQFIFPTNMFLTTFLLGMVTSTAGSYFAIQNFREKSISTIIQGLI